MAEHQYTVCLLVSADRDKMLLVRKQKTSFRNMLNGVGGAIEDGETPYEGALREIQEETGLEQDDLMALKTARLAFLGQLRLPYDCKTFDGSECVLHYYTGVIKPEAYTKIRPADELLEWRPVDRVISAGVNNSEYAGEGDLSYFAGAAMRMLDGILPSAKPEPRNGLADQLADAKSILDESLQARDYMAASVAAGNISRMAYTAWYLATAKHPDPSSQLGTDQIV